MGGRRNGRRYGFKVVITFQTNRLRRLVWRRSPPSAAPTMNRRRDGFEFVRGGEGKGGGHVLN